MNTKTKLATYAAALAPLAGGAYAAGSTVGPRPPVPAFLDFQHDSVARTAEFTVPTTPASHSRPDAHTAQAGGTR